MPENINVEIDGDSAYVSVTDGKLLGPTIRKLLDAADDRDDVQTSTERPGLLGLRVPAALVRKAGLVDGDAGKPEKPLTPAQKAAATRKAKEQAAEKAAADEAARAKAEADATAAAEAEAERIAAEAAAEAGNDQAGDAGDENTGGDPAGDSAGTE